MNHSATASLHSATPKKNVPCFPDLAGVKFLLKVERTFFFGVLPSRSRAGGGTMRTKFWQSNFLGKGFAKTSALLFLNSDVANGKGGVWGGIFHLLLFLFWGNSGRTKNKIQILFLYCAPISIGKLFKLSCHCRIAPNKFFNC